MRRMSACFLAWSSALAALACGPEGDRTPPLEANSQWREARVEERDGVRLVENAAARDNLETLEAQRAVDATWLVFWGDQAVARDGTGQHYVASTEAHEILLLDEGLRYAGSLAPQGPDGQTLRRPQSIAVGPGSRFAAFEASGTVTLFDRWGREFDRFQSPFSHAIGAWGPGSQLTLVRSPYTVAFVAEPPDSPLLLTVNPSQPKDADPVGRVRKALQSIYTHAANAGAVTVDGAGNIYYAALSRGEVHRYSAAGRLTWISRRPTEFETPEPRLVPSREGAPKLALATVQKAIATGPDGLLYVRAVSDPAGARERLDVLDPETGEWLRSAPLDTGTAVLVGRRGAVWQIPTEELLTKRFRQRREFESFALETFAGDSLASADLRGRVALVAFWASWCGPCRDELPLLDSLHRAVDRPDFVAIGINEDVNERDGRAFAQELGLEMTLLLGRGRMRGKYHYSGLPYSVLLDREGRIVREYYGFGGREAFDAEVTSSVLAELASLAAREAQTSADAMQQAVSEHRSPDRQGHDVATTSAEHRRHAGATSAPMDHDHGSSRVVRGDEMAALARYLPEARRARPRIGSSVPVAHWKRVLDGLALVDHESNEFLKEHAGTFELVQLLSLKTQLYVDADRLPSLDDPAKFAEGWRTHLRSLSHLVKTYETLKRQEADSVQ